MLEAPSGTALPIEVTTFVGRRAERQQVRSLLAESHLVTLTGFGGVGKTRLALRLAADLRRAFSDGIVFVPLATQSDPDLVAQTIVTALGLQGRSTRAAATSLVDYLSTRSVLLVLDNCEHLVDATAVLTDTLLRTCPDLRILATSRDPLRILGEAVHPVTPLSVPPRGDTTTPLHQFEAVSLFLDRARAVVPGFELTDDNRDAVAAVVSQLEGIPLAIELAAGRLRAMSPNEIEQNLTERWDLLNRGSRTAPDRQRTMSACIEWSFDLCSPSEQALWGALSVFTDGFELDAAHTVCDDLDPDLDDTLLSLVEKSIVLPTTYSGRSRFRMLPPIRSRGVRHLDAKDMLVDLRRRHRDWAVDLACEAHRSWLGPRQVDYIHRLRRETGNMQAALEFCTTYPGEAEPGLLMGSCLLEFGLAEGLFREGRMWFDRLLTRSHEETEVRALALRTACWWAAMQGDLEHAAALLEQGRVLAERHGGHTQVLLTQASAFVSMFSGELESATEQFEQAIAGFKEHGDRSQQAHAHALASLNYTFRGDLDGALAEHEACLAITEPAGESWYRSYSLWIAGLAIGAQGDVVRAERLQKESLQLKRLTADRLGIGVSLEALAWLSSPGDAERAARLMGAAQGLWDRIETSTEALAGLHVHHLDCVARLRGQLGDESYAKAFGEGRGLEPEAAIDLALEEQQPARRSRARAVVADGPAVLTRREQQIAQLVATGLSNKDIATTLVISKRTAETHVEHILVKLGFTNRNQIAAWMREQAASAGR